MDEIELIKTIKNVYKDLNKLNETETRFKIIDDILESI